MIKYLANLEKILPSVKNIFIPAAVFMFAAFGFFSFEQFEPATNMTLHCLFYLTALGIFIVLLFYNLSKPIFFILCTVFCYILINYLKIKYGSDYISSSAYQNLCLLAPLNFAVFYFLPNRPLLKIRNVYILLAFFAEYAVGEYLSRHSITLNLEFNPMLPLSSIAFLLFIGMLTCAFIKSTLNGSIMDYALFFAELNITMGFYFSNVATALSLFFCCAIISLAIALGLDIYRRTYKDSLTGLDSRNSYIIQSKNFPLKYSIGIISIDNYENIGRNFGRRAQQNITRLIAAKIIELSGIDENIYHYSNDEFVILYKNLDKNETFERLEIIRRTIASASFEYSSRRMPIKITISAAVSEKKRSDANSFEVLVRAHKVLEKTRSFSHNVTSKA